MSSERVRSERASDKGGLHEGDTVLVTGASGGLALTTVSLLAEKYRLVGVDPRPLSKGEQFPGDFYEVDYRQRKMAEVFRSHKFRALVHLGRVPVTSKARQSTRFNLNVLGTRSLLDLAVKYAVEHVVVCSTFHVYGAHQHNHLYITEDDPLRASQTFPELSDAVELDNVSTSFLLKHPEIRTTLLRPVNIIGPRINNQISKLLRGDFCPVLFGYDPLQQFIHETDFARALILALEASHSGIYNVAGEGVVPFSRAVELAGAKAFPVPHFWAYPLASLVSNAGFSFPKHLVDYFRYPTILTDAAFRRDFGYVPSITTVEALRSIRVRGPSGVH